MYICIICIQREIRQCMYTYSMYRCIYTHTVCMLLSRSSLQRALETNETPGVQSFAGWWKADYRFLFRPRKPRHDLTIKLTTAGRSRGGKQRKTNK